MVENYQLNDWYFSKFDNVLNLSYVDLMNNSFLVRHIIDECPKIQLCYKKKELDKFGNVLLEEKVKSDLTKLENAVKIFDLAGLNNYCKVENNSFVYINKSADVRDIEYLWKKRFGLLQTPLDQVKILLKSPEQWAEEDSRYYHKLFPQFTISIEYEEDESMKDLSPDQKFSYMVNITKNLGLKLGNDFSCKKVFMLLHKK